MKYKTKQTDILIDELKTVGSRGVTANKMIDILNGRYDDVSRATIYRKLKVFEDEGVVRVINRDGKKYYALVEDDCDQHLHLVCTNSDKIIHLETKEANDFVEYLEKLYNFKIDFSKTVIYGTCEDEE